MDLPAVGLGPDKTAPLKPLREKPDSVLRCPEDFYEVAPAAPEDVDVASQRILFKRCLYLCGQSLEPTSHIGHACSDPDARTNRQRDHDRRLPSTVRSMSASTRPSTLITARPMRISIVPPGDAGFISGACGTPEDDATTCVSASLSSATGRRLVDGACCSARYRRRQLYNMFALMPFSRASLATETPGSHAAAASWSRSSRG